MDDRFLVSVLHRIASLDEQLQTVSHWKGTIIAIASNCNAADIFHDKERPPTNADASVEDAGHVVMGHQRQRLTLCIKANDDFRRVHTQFDQLDSHDAPQGMRLLCAV